MASNVPISQSPRTPSVGELKELVSWLCSIGHDQEVATDLTESASVAVYDNYVTDCPGYAGKLMSVVWSGSPSFFDVFIWEKGRLTRSGRDYDEKECDRCGNKNGTLCWNCWQQERQ